MKRILKIFVIGFISTSIVGSLFVNCSPQPLQTDFSSKATNTTFSCEPHCDEKPKYDHSETPLFETLHNRQYLESYLSLLDLSLTDVGTDLSRLLAEKNRRSVLLPSSNKSSLMSSIVFVSSTALAGETCRVYVNKKAKLSTYFAKINWTTTTDTHNADDWVEAWKLMVEDFYARPILSQETDAVKELVLENIEDAKTSPHRTAVTAGLNLESANLAVMLCTLALATPEGSGI